MYMRILATNINRQQIASKAILRKDLCRPAVTCEGVPAARQRSRTSALGVGACRSSLTAEQAVLRQAPLRRG